jgi:hypothetical protein
LAVVGGGSGNVIRKMLPKVLALMAAGCTVLLGLQSAQADRTLAWALPSALYLGGAVLLMTPPTRRRAARVAVAGFMAVDAVGISLAFFVLMGRNPNALVFGGVFLFFAVIEALSPATAATEPA